MSKLTPPVGEHDHIQGSKKALVTLVEYGDYECPYCGQAYHVVKKIQSELAEFGEDILSLVYRHFPLTQIHPHAFNAACAAEAAGLQGKFWEMHDELFEHQFRLGYEPFASFADALGLNVVKFLEDMGLSKVHQKIRSDFMSGIRSGVNGTPTFFINGVRHEGSYQYDALKPAIESIYLKELAKKQL